MSCRIMDTFHYGLMCDCSAYIVLFFTHFTINDKLFFYFYNTFHKFLTIKPNLLLNSTNPFFISYYKLLNIKTEENMILLIFNYSKNHIISSY